VMIPAAQAALTSDGKSISAGGTVMISRRSRPPLQLQISPIRNSMIRTSEPLAAVVLINDPLHQRPTQDRIGDMTDRARLQIDARKWALSKLIPKKYGDRSDPGQRDPLAELVECMKETSKRIGPPEGSLQRAVEEGG
jgi:hypothetical protein